MGEDLVAFRDTTGKVGLIQNNCPHRGASLFFGRNEESGLRCVYHGWKFDVDGNCLDMPNEPAESDFKHKVHAVTYPTEERGGLIWAYMGPPELRPSLPQLEWTVVPDSHRFVSKRLQESNFLQAMEGGIDSSHVSFLHSWIDKSRRPPLPLGSLAKYLDADRHPHFEVLDTDYGLVVGARRNAEEDSFYWRITQFLVPWFQMIPADPGGSISGHAWIPIDDEHCWAWTVTWNPAAPLSDPEIARLESGHGVHATVDRQYRTLANMSNDYLIDRQKQRHESFTGIKGIGEQDMACQEGMGPIYDRTQEHLGSSDTAIIQMRRRLQQLCTELEAGHEPVAASRPDAYRVRSTTLLLKRDEDWTEAARRAMVAASPHYVA
jgi:nitrite reductase/ring-hydroxylating ferredoxin subunit